MVYSLIELSYKNKPDVADYFSTDIFSGKTNKQVKKKDVDVIINENWLYQKVETPALLFFIIIMTATWSFLRRMAKRARITKRIDIFIVCLNKEEKKDKSHLVEYLKSICCCNHILFITVCNYQ